VLFDLRSRGRRRAVRVIYVGLALLMLSGLVLFGVGAGNNNGGLLNAFTGSGSSSGQTAVIDSQTKAAIKATQKNPDSASAWASLIQARFDAAGEGSNYNSATGYTASGKKQLEAAAVAWTRYLTLTKDKPGIAVATLMGEAYSALDQYAGEASAWEYVVNDQPTEAKGYFCLAVSAYAAKQTRKGSLAAAEAVKLVPKLQRLELQQELTAAKTSDSYAQQC
jgi:hypothetical protein